jgi:hypothetical protein
MTTGKCILFQPLTGPARPFARIQADKVIRNAVRNDALRQRADQKFFLICSLLEIVNLVEEQILRKVLHCRQTPIVEARFTASFIHDSAARYKMNRRNDLGVMNERRGKPGLYNDAE